MEMDGRERRDARGIGHGAPGPGSGMQLRLIYGLMREADRLKHEQFKALSWFGRLSARGGSGREGGGRS